MTECHFPNCQLQNDCFFRSTGAVHECPHVKKATLNTTTEICHLPQVTGKANFEITMKKTFFPQLEKLMHHCHMTKFSYNEQQREEILLLFVSNIDTIKINQTIKQEATQ